MVSHTVHDLKSYTGARTPKVIGATQRGCGPSATGLPTPHNILPDAAVCSSCLECSLADVSMIMREMRGSCPRSEQEEMDRAEK